MPSGGHNRKTAAELKLHGTFRKDRHGDLEKAPQIAERLKKPTGMSREASALWDKIVARYERSKMLTAQDAETLRVACETFSHWKRADATLRDDPTDASARTSFIQLAQAWRTFAAAFGLTPLDRQRLREPPMKEDESPLSQFTRKRG